MTTQYLSSPKALRLYLKENRTPFGFHAVQFGNMHAWCIGSLPILTKQFNPNFKTKFFVLNVPLASVARHSPAVNPVSTSSPRTSRLYLNIGSLPYFDNGSGIPRVAKELCHQGLLREDVECIPVYPEPRSGTYRIPLAWLKERQWLHLSKTLSPLSQKGDEDPVVTVQKGDWLIHTMVNRNEIAFMQSWMDDFRRKGGKVGFVLHDLIPENHPEFYRNRDVVQFRDWLSQIGRYDGIFAISQATQNDYLQWCRAHGVDTHPPVKFFHLGANFKTSGAATSASTLPKPLDDCIPYFLMVSTLEPRKGHAQVLDAFERLWSQGINVRCVFVGREGWKVRDLTRRIRQHKELGQRLIWLDRVSDDELTSIYRGSRAVIVASKAEGFGLSVVEALFHQKPLVLCDIPVFREIAGDSAFYFTGADAEGLSQSMLDALHSHVIPQQIRPLTWAESFDQFFKLVKGLAS